MEDRVDNEIVEMCTLVMKIVEYLHIGNESCQMLVFKYEEKLYLICWASFCD